MKPRPLTWALVLLGSALALALSPAPAPEAREKLCGHHFVRALVRLCGGPRWSPEDGRRVAGGDREWGRARAALWGFQVGQVHAALRRDGRMGLHAPTGVPRSAALVCVPASQGCVPCQAGNQCVASEAVWQVPSLRFQDFDLREFLH